MSGLKRQLQQLRADLDATTDSDAPLDVTRMSDDELTAAIRRYVHSLDPAARREFHTVLQADGATPDDLREFGFGDEDAL